MEGSESVTMKRERRTIDDRREAILDAAEHLFLTIGSKVSLGAVVTRSGGSLATLYAQFENKQGLLRAVVDRARERELGGIETLILGEPSQRGALLRFAQEYVRFISSPTSIALMRVVVSESFANLQFCQSFGNEMVERHNAGLASTLRTWNDEGKVQIPNAAKAAELFFASILMNAPLRRLLGEDVPIPTREDLEWRLAPFFEHFQIV